MLDLVEVGKSHRTGVEGGDLVVVEVGGDESLGCEAARYLTHVAARQTQLVETVEVGRCIVTDRSHDQRRTAEQQQIVGNVSGATAILAAHLRHQKGHIQNVNLLGQDVILEAVGKDHDVVEGERTADQGVHGRVCQG